MFFVVGKPHRRPPRRADRLADRPVRRQRRPARHPPRPDDVLRPRRAGQQGRLHLRHRRPDHRHRRRGTVTPSAALKIMAAVMAAGMIPPLGMALATAVRSKLFTAARARERQGRLGAGRLLHLRGRDPVRRGRPAAGHPVLDGRRRVTGALSMAFGSHAARPARRHLRGPADRQPVPVPARHRGRRLRHRRRGHRPEA